MLLIVSAIYVWLAQGDWVMVDSNFLKGFTSNNDWQISKTCNIFESGANHQYYTCVQNFIRYARLKKDNQRIDKIFNQKSYQSEVIVDIFFDNAGSPSDKQAYFTLNLTQSSSTKDILQQRNYFNSDLTQNARQICNSSTTQYFDFMTYVGTSPALYKEKFNISIGIEAEDDNQQIGVRNLFVYVKYCLPTCKTCSSSTSCLTCYYGTLSSGGSCICNPSHQFAQTGIGCRQECERDYYIARSDNICVPDRRIRSNISYFDSIYFFGYLPFQFIQDTVNLRSSTQLIFLCSNNFYVGSLVFNEGMSLQFANSQSLKFIRLRITFYIKGFLIDNRIQIILDDQVQGEIIKTSSNYSFNNVKKIQSTSITCTNTYDLIRIEAILRTYYVTPKLILKGVQLTQATSTWGFRNITIDSGNCQENCAVCTDFSTCRQCDINYVLFQNSCVSACPVHSANCIDYADMIPNSRYLAKGFYNLNMSTQDINNFYDVVISTGSNFLTGQKFSIFPTKFVLGGVMVWNNAIYKKSWSISKPHYAVTIRLNLTYGDQYNGNFYYTIQGIKSVAHPKPSSGGQNFIGKNLNEITKYFEIFQSPFTSSSLDIEFQCTDTTADPRDQFCAISDYFIVVHYCLPFCQICNDGVSCVIWESGHTSQNCNTNQFLQFDSNSETYSCITCNQPGCLTCKNLEECTSCDFSKGLNNGVCFQCNKFCETCKGSLKTDCITCVSDFQRFIFNNQCQCLPGYYDDDINLPCHPVCGDLLVVDGEDCDDGNNNPFDGCHNCKYGCDAFCQECIQGVCYLCQNDLQIINNKCVGICGDNITSHDEQCDDGNIISFDGCFECQYQCQAECTDCKFGLCYDCSIKGWQLFNNYCIPFCGDGYVIEGFEECDDGNIIPFDGCFECQFQCQIGCIECQENQCLKCDENQYQFDVQKLKCTQINNVDNDQEIDMLTLQLQQFTQLRCGDNYLLVDYICVNQCGNGLLSSQSEACDDGNNVGGDGCSAFCQIEDKYQCLNQNGSLSQCTYIQAPELSLNILSNKANSIQIVELTFTQEVKLNEDLKLEEFMLFSILPQTQYKLSIKIISNITINLNNPKFEIEIEFIEPIQNPVLQVDIQKDTIYNQFQIGLKEYQHIFNLSTPFVLQQATKEQLASVSQLNDAMMYYSMASVSSLALLTGNAIMFFNLLDLLQSLSYLRFMQYEFPPHLTAFLNTYTKVSLQPILNYFQIDQLLIKLNRGQTQYQPNGKSNQEILHQLYLFNVKSCYFSVFASILSYLICCLLVSKILDSFASTLTKKHKYNFKILKIINFFQKKVQKNCLNLKIEYFSLGIYKVFQAILHQLMFSLLIQFPNYAFNTPFEIFNSINAIFGLIYIFKLIYPLFTITTSQIKNEKKWKYFYYESKLTFWAVQFKTLQIYKIIFYILIIVKLINYPEAQSIFLSMQSSFFLIYLIKFKPTKSTYENLKIICREFLFMLISASFLLYSFEFSQDNLIIIGWIHIGMFCAILASNLFIDLSQQILKIYHNYQLKIQKEKIKEERKYFFNQLQGFSVAEVDYYQKK